MSIASKHNYRFGYLKSEEWQNVRAQVLARDEGKCFICNLFSTRNDVHHRRYPRNVWDTEPEDCIVLCRKCHKLVHAVIAAGCNLEEINTLRKLRKYVRKKQSEHTLQKREEMHRKAAKLDKRSQCFSCRQCELSLTPFSPFPGGNKPMYPDQLWCDECIAACTFKGQAKWSILRKFMHQRREDALKKVFDKAMRTVDIPNMVSESGSEKLRGVHTLGPAERDQSYN